MPFPTYLSTLHPPSHPNAYRRVLQQEKIDFSQRLDAKAIAERTAHMFLPPGCCDPRRQSREDCGIFAMNGLPQITLQFITDKKTAAVTTLADRFSEIARDTQLQSHAAKGRAVLRAIAEKLRPALEAGPVGRTGMAQAAALEIAVAMANRRNISIGWRAAMDAANGLNPVGCKLGTPSQWGVSIVAAKGDGRVTMCESTAWDRYHWNGEKLEDHKARRKGKRPIDLVAGDDPDPNQPVVAVTPHNVICQAGRALVADVQTTFSVKTNEWWLTRLLLRRRDQRATVAAKIQMVGFESSEQALHDALAYENRSWGHTARNWLARLCRFMRGIAIGKLGKREYAYLDKFRPLRDPIPVQPPEVPVEEGNWDTIIAQCGETANRKVQLLGKRARSAARRSGTWSGDRRYAGKVELKLRFLDGPGIGGGKEHSMEYVNAPDETPRTPMCEAIATADVAERLNLRVPF